MRQQIERAVRGSETENEERERERQRERVREIDREREGERTEPSSPVHDGGGPMHSGCAGDGEEPD